MNLFHHAFTKLVLLAKPFDLKLKKNFFQKEYKLVLTTHTDITCTVIILNVYITQKTYYVGQNL